jgi:ADP-ribosylglycohydrolase
MQGINEMRKAFDVMVGWLDMHDDQGGNISPMVRSVMRQMQSVARKCASAAPAKSVTASEPNDLSDILAARAKGPRRLLDKVDWADYRRRLRGALLARMAGCTLGAPIEGSSIAHMEAIARHSRQSLPLKDYWTYHPTPWLVRYNMSSCGDYLRQNLRHVPVDDDVTYTLLGLLIMEDSGVDFSVADVGKAWLKYLPLACTAEEVALDNLKKGMSWKKVGQAGNRFVEWIGADIRSDPWGYVCPGLPQKAAELAWRDGYISHRYGGLYGEMYFSAAIAAAFAVNDSIEACEIALTEIPRRSRCYEGIRWALRTAPKVRDYHQARKLVDERFPGMSGVHTINNAALTIFGLAMGGRDVTKVIGNVVMMGLDNDCTAATAGSIVGAVVGGDKVPQHWYKPFNNRIRTYMIDREWFTITDVLKRFESVARQVWAKV